MRTVSLNYSLAENADAVFETISGFDRYKLYADAVNNVAIDNVKDNSCESTWEVKFRDGLLKWREKDVFIRDQYRIEFFQLKGDLELFDGYWSVQDVGSHKSILYFEARLDLGLPQLEKLLEPIAGQALSENIDSIVAGLFGNRLLPVESDSNQFVESV